MIITTKYICGIMKQEETGNLSRDELFEKIKRKCISRSRVSFYGGLFIMIMIIAWLIYRGTNPFNDADISGPIYAIVLACLAGWLALYSYWYQKRIKRIDNPSELLNFYEKKSRSLMLFCLCGWLVWLVVKFVNFFRSTTIDFEFVLLAIVFVPSVYLIYVIHKPGSVPAKDMEIIEQLRDLIDDKE